MLTERPRRGYAVGIQEFDTIRTKGSVYVDKTEYVWKMVSAINGTGFYYIEPQTRNNSRMDLVVTYSRKEFIVELKIWRGEKYEERGRDQLAGYLATRGLDEGYLVTFDFSKHRVPAEPHWAEHGGKRIFEVII